MSLLLACVAMVGISTSYYPVRLDDPKAVYLEPTEGDATASIQKAIDSVGGPGIIFVSSGRYRLTDTIKVWPGVRLIGYGPTRPVIYLRGRTPGYEQVEKFMVFFAGRRLPETSIEDPGRTVEQNGGDFGMPNEANPGTFYSAMSNIDLEIEEGNLAAVGVRGRYAQHCYLSHMDFRLGSALAGIHDIGNIAEDLRFFGGQYGLITRTPSPGWQFTLMDSSFEGQSKAAIRTHETGLAFIRPIFRHVPTAIEVAEGYTEQLFMKDGTIEDVSGPALVLPSDDRLRVQVNLENVACSKVPLFTAVPDSGTTSGSTADSYAVTTLSHGLRYEDLGAEGKTESGSSIGEPQPIQSDIAQLPPRDEWVNLRELGAKGDGVADDTAVLREAIAKHRSIYLPQGRYRVTDTIVLKPDTVLVGLNPLTTQILITDATLGFGSVPEPTSDGSALYRSPSIPFAGKAKALVEAPSGGRNIVTGIGIDTGGNNPSACGLLWQAGRDSMVDDVKFLGGHGSGVAQIYDADHTMDPNPSRRWDSQYPSLWVTNGGGGTFKNIWTASPYAQAGMLVSDTDTPGSVYEMSSEHHVRNEVQVHRASNWSFYALQTEEERGEGPFCLPVDIQDSHDITFANLNMYRVVSMYQPFPYAVRLSGSRNVRFRGVHCYSNSKVSFDSSIYDQTTGVELRQREFAWLDVQRPTKRRSKSNISRLAGGFYNISGGAVAPNGDFYFVDARFQRIYRWDGHLSTFQDAPLMPVNVVFDRAGNLIVVSYAGRGMVYSVSPDRKIEQLVAEPARERSSATVVLPVSDWSTNPLIVAGKPLQRPYHFVSSDGSLFLPAGQDFIDGSLSWGTKLQDLIRSFGLAKATPGKPFYVTAESDCRTYAVDVLPDGKMTNGRVFAEQGGEGVAVDSRGRVYIAAGQIYVYDPSGKWIDTIEVPERPTQIVFGGKEGKTLFICARTSLYSMRVP